MTFSRKMQQRLDQVADNDQTKRYVARPQGLEYLVFDQRSGLILNEREVMAVPFEKLRGELK